MTEKGHAEKAGHPFVSHQTTWEVLKVADMDHKREHRRVVLLRNIHCHEVDITTDLLGFTKDQMFNASQQCSFLWAVVTDRDREIAVFVSPKVHYNFKAARICREVASFTTSQKSQRTREKADAIWGPKS